MPSHASNSTAFERVKTAARPRVSTTSTPPRTRTTTRWSEGAALARRISATEDPTDHRRLLFDLGAVMTGAYGATDGTTEWWAARLPPPR